MGKAFTFKKDTLGKWYVILPEWKGDKEELEMVSGADVMLDILAQGENTINVHISTENTPFVVFKLSLDRLENDGAWYKLKSEFYEFDVWLCHVVKFVFNGEIPEKLYIF